MSWFRFLNGKVKLKASEQKTN